MTFTGSDEPFDEVEGVGSLPREIAPPPELRVATLRAVRQARVVRRWRRGLGTVTAIAAMVVVAIALQPRRKSASDFPGAGRELLARDHAQPDFDALDNAEREITAALQEQPEDAQLSAALTRVHRQRDALRQLIAQVNQ